jgi:hypothetical protein
LAGRCGVERHRALVQASGGGPQIGDRDLQISLRGSDAGTQERGERAGPRHALALDLSDVALHLGQQPLALAGQPLPDPPMITTGVVPSRIDALAGSDDPRRGRRLEWSRLPKREYQLDVLICPICAGPMVALIEGAP